MIFSNSSKTSSFNGANNSPGYQRLNEARQKSISRYLPPLPVFALAPILNHIVNSIANKHPELFTRLGQSAKKTFLIDPTNLPFFLILQPDPKQPKLKAHNRNIDISHDVYIAGSFATLLKMIDSQSDSDAMFFNREIIVSGDSEAMVALRNALDDIEDTIVDDVAASFGPLSFPVRKFFDVVNKVAKPK